MTEQQVTAKTEEVERLLTGEWLYEGAHPQCLEFFKPASIGDWGSLNVTMYPVKTVLRTLEYEVLVAEYEVCINIRVKSAEQIVQYIILKLDSHEGQLWLRDSLNHALHYVRIKSQADS